MKILRSFLTILLLLFVMVTEAHYVYGVNTIDGYSNFIYGNYSQAFGKFYNYDEPVASNSNGDFVFEIKDGKVILTGYIGSDTYVVLPNNYNGDDYEIGDNVFADRSDIINVIIPDGVTAIGESAFNRCWNLESITIPQSVRNVKKLAFSSCENLKEVRISDLAVWCDIDFSTEASNPLYYADNLYLNGFKVTDLNIPDGVETIKKYAFCNFSTIRSVSIPGSVTSVGDDVFYNCDNIEDVYISDLAAWCNIDFSTHNSNPLYYADNLYLNGFKVTDLNIPDGVETIKSYTFYHALFITSVTIPSSVTAIENNAFDACFNIKTIVNYSDLVLVKESFAYGGIALYAEEVSNMGYYSVSGDFAFKRINGVNILSKYIGSGVNIYLPENCEGEEYIIGEAFRNNHNINSISIPSGVVAIGDYAFSGCSELSYVTIGNSVATIGAEAFRDCSKLTSIELGKSVAIIGTEAFRGCSKLASIEFGNNVVTIGERAFVDCSGLTSVELGRNTKTIGAEAFRDCFRITSINIPASVTSIGGSAFSGCSSLQVVSIDELEPWFNIDFETPESNPLYYARDLFENYKNKKISELEIPIRTTNIKKNAFYNCQSITTVIVPEGLTTIGDKAFHGCINLKKIINNSKMLFTKGSYDYGEIAYNVDEIINNYNGTEGDFQFKIIDGKYVLYEYLGNDSHINLPSLNGISYVVADSLFYGKSEVLSVTIPDNVTAIGDYAFCDCSSLTSVTIGNGVTTIGESAFRGCYSLTSVVIGNGVTTIGESAFFINSIEDVYISDIAAWCNIDFEGENSNPLFNGAKLYLNEELVTDLTIPEGVEYIKDYAFFNCTLFNRVTIPNSVTAIGDYAFYNCSGLTGGLVIPDMVTTIGDAAFYGCTGLTGRLIIPNSVTSIGGSAFYGCSGLTGDLVIPDMVTTIGASAFSGCDELTGIKIPNSVTSIGEAAFYNCSSLIIVVIGNGVTTIEDATFSGCSCLMDLVIPDSVTTIGEDAFKNCFYLTSLVIPDMVTTIGVCAFVGCTNLTSVVIGNGVTAIGDLAFYNCRNLKTVYNFSDLIFDKRSTYYGYIVYYADEIFNLPGGGSVDDFLFERIDGVKTLYKYLGTNKNVVLPETYKGKSYAVGDSVFYNNKELYSITIPDSVKSIGASAFEDCSGLTSVTVGSGVTKIGDYAFHGCTNIKDVYINSLRSWCDIDFSTFSSTPSSYASNIYINGNLIADIVIPEDIKKIKDYTFYGFSFIKSVTIPENVTAIGDYAFRGCSKLSSIEIPNSVTTIGNNAFRNCTGLTKIVIPNSVTSIGASAFERCSGLTSVIVGSGVTKIGDYAFYDCNNLALIYNFSKLIFTKGTSDYGCIGYYASTLINASGGSIEGDFVFMKNGDTPILVEYLGNDTEIVLPDSYKGQSYEIGKEVFKYKNIKSVAIPENVTAIGEDAFSGCSKLSSIEIPNSVTTIGNNAFRNCTGLTKIVIPNSVTSIGESAFSDCLSLQEVRINDLVAWCNIDFETAGSNPLYGANLYLNEDLVTDLTIPEGVQYIKKYAFCGLEGVEAVIIPNSVKIIGNSAFSGSSVAYLLIGNGVVTIEDYAFYCLNLKSISLSSTRPVTCNENVFYKYGWGTNVYVPVDSYNAYRQTQPWNKFSNLAKAYVSTITYVVDGEVYKEVELAAGSLIPEVVPTKEGYSFGGWVNLPKVMPLVNIEINGSFVLNNYTITYRVDDADYAVESVSYGSTIPPVDNPVKEGYTFNGWIGKFAFPIDIASNADKMLYSNAYCTETSYGDQFAGWHVLFDGNSNTIFHSEYANKNSSDKLDHYWRVDMGAGKDVKEFSFTYTTRDIYSDVNSPTTIVVEGSNTANGGYTEIATLTDLPITNSTIYKSEILGNGNAYRYIRFRVTETNSNQSVQGHPFFFIAEFGMTEYKEVSLPDVMPANDITVDALFLINKYLLSYKVDAEVYASDSIVYNNPIVPIDEPTKEGHTFSGWSEIPETMPAYDVTIKGAFAVNNYSVTYLVDGGEYAEYTVEYGAAVPLPDAPEKEGYTFSWSDVPETMPASNLTIDGNFAINSYTVTYLVDGGEYAEYTVEYGAAVPVVDIPEKEGHTFSGWSEIPETMPAYDVTIKGAFAVNNYSVTYLVDGGEYAEYTVEYGAAVPVPDAPEKEGYTFSWSDIPETMPASNLTIDGNFAINSYSVTYLVDGGEYAEYTVEYGATVPVVDIPEKEGHTFSGWSEIPEIMPAYDVTIKGVFAVNNYSVTYLVDGGEYAEYTVEYGAAVPVPDAPEKEGYTFSWSDVPETMPASNLTIDGNFAINSYTVTYLVDGGEYAEYTVEYGATVPVVDIPEKEGHTFSGWSEIPEIMPAYDVTIKGVFAVNNYSVTYLVDGGEYAEYTVEYGAAVPVPDNPTKEGYIFEGWTSIPATIPAQDIVIEAIFSVDTGIIGLNFDKPQNVYSLSGILIKRKAKAEDIMMLPQGTYIIGGTKVYLR